MLPSQPMEKFVLRENQKFDFRKFATLCCSFRSKKKFSGKEGNPGDILMHKGLKSTLKLAGFCFDGVAQARSFKVDEMGSRDLQKNYQQAPGRNEKGEVYRSLGRPRFSSVLEQQRACFQLNFSDM